MSTPYPYEVTEDPRSLSDEDLAFLSKYTGVKDYDQLRKHVLEVWRSVKAQVRGLHGCMRHTSHACPPHFFDSVSLSLPPVPRRAGCTAASSA